LADVNFWLALNFKNHPHSDSAWQWMKDLDATSCLFCSMTQQGFLRLATNPRVVSSPLTHVQAWSKYDSFLSDERIEFIDEPPDMELVWRSFSKGRRYSPRIWNDAYLAAFACTARLKMVTFDKGFKAYEGLSVELLS